MDAVTEGRWGLIAGVAEQPLKVIADHRGAVLHMLRADSPHFSRFGELYFSEVNPGIVKGWKKHLRMTQRFAVPVGKLRFVLFDAREKSPTRGVLQEIIAGRPDHYKLLLVPAGLWYAFQNAGPTPALLTNCADLMHDPAESITTRLDDPTIPFQWQSTA